MYGITLLREAQAAGLSVRVDGDKLVVRGPKTAEAVALRLLAHKPEVMAALHLGADHELRRGELRDHSPVCRWPWQGRTPHRRFWESIFGVTICGHCSPPAYPGLVLRWLEPQEN